MQLLSELAKEYSVAEIELESFVKFNDINLNKKGALQLLPYYRKAKKQCL